jgi:prepilin-type N-terminal cleavage/methylation domain-containing protein/prepilin-type processing-associated H-X9-DG protein
MKLRLFRRRQILAFTLVELLVVIAIIALLASLSLPSIESVMQRARSIQCTTNLRTIGLAAMQAATDNNNTYPEIDQAAAPIYPAGSGATNLVGALGPYGVTTNTIQCTVDLGQSPSAFKTYHSSYEWSPVFDDENPNNPVIAFGPNVKIPVHSSHVRLCSDFFPIHNGKSNSVYGDGHVRAR